MERKQITLQEVERILSLVDKVFKNPDKAGEIIREEGISYPVKQNVQRTRTYDTVGRL